MANTYTQIHIHAVFTVQNWSCIIHSEWKEELYKYITGIIKNNKHKLLAINGMPDHVHIPFGLHPIQSISDLLQDIKGGSSKWINKRKLINGKFSWQEGYGAFSYAKSDLPKVINYINNQKNNHKQITFIDEYIKLLQQFGIDYNDNYIFKPIGVNHNVPDGT